MSYRLHTNNMSWWLPVFGRNGVGRLTQTDEPLSPSVSSVCIKCVWYASNTECLRANLRSVLWGPGVKGYPAHWWRGALRSFYYKAGLERVVAFKQLREWAVDGKEWRRCRASA